MRNNAGKEKVGKDIALVGIAQVVSGLTAFLLIPIMTRALGPEGYGEWNQVLTTVTLLATLGELGLSSSLIRFMASEKDEARLRDGFYSILVFATIVASALAVVVALLSGPLALELLQDRGMAYVFQFGALLIVANTVEAIMLAHFRVRGETKTFVSMVLLRSIGQPVMVIVLLPMGVFGAVIAYISVFAIELGASLCLAVSRLGWALPSFSRLREFLSFGLPLTPTELIRWVIDSSDRYIVTILLGVGAVGVYSANYSIGSVLFVLVVPIQFALFPSLSRHYDNGRYDEVGAQISYSIQMFLMVAIPAVFGLMVLAAPLIDLISGPQFVSGASVVPIVALSTLFFGVFQFMVNSLNVIKKTRTYLLINGVSAGANVVLNFALIPVFGLNGAALATLVSSIIMAFLAYRITVQHFQVHIPWTVYLKYVLASALMSLALTMFSPDSYLEMGLAVALGMAIYLASLVIIRGFTRKDLNVLLGSIR